jgi:DNA repair protein RadD
MQLRDYQQAAIDALYGYFAARDGNPLIILPTGAGKSVVIAAFVHGVFDRWPGQRVLVLTHVKELIEQNHERMVGYWPQAPAGIYSASLNRRDVFDPIIFAGIQSVYRKAQALGHFDLVLVDECHLIGHSADGMYRRFLDDLRRINPALKVIGLTATAFRTGTGDITYGEQRIFTDVAYELPIQALLERGHLAPLVSKRTAAEIDLSNVHVRQGEFIAAELEAAIDQDEITRAAVAEIIRYGQARRSWLVFCSGVRHALHVQAELQRCGIPAGCVTGDTPRAERERIIEHYRSGALRAITNANVLTTGFDAPQTDLIGFLRPTCSPGLYVQMAGRGMRTAPGKRDCLVLDFAGNVSRHGPVDQVRPWRPHKKAGGQQAAPTHDCPECQTILPAQTRVCPECGYEWPIEPRHAATASDLAILSSAEDPSDYIVTLPVDEVAYSRHAKPGKIPSLRVDYTCGLRRFSEWVCLEHTGYPRNKAASWWARRDALVRWADGFHIGVPAMVEDALEQIERLRVPATITINTKPKYPEIIGYGFEQPHTEQEGDDAGDAAGGPGDRPGPARHHAMPAV